MTERIGMISLRSFDLTRYDELKGIRTEDRLLRFPEGVLPLGTSHPSIPATNVEAPALSRTPDRTRKTALADLKPLMDAYWDMICQRSRTHALEQRIRFDREADRLAAYKFYLARDRMGDWVRAFLFQRTYQKIMDSHRAYLTQSQHKLDLTQAVNHRARIQQIEDEALFPKLFQKAVADPFVPQPRMPNQIKDLPLKLTKRIDASTKHTELNTHVATARELLSSWLLAKMYSDRALHKLLSEHDSAKRSRQKEDEWLKVFDRAWLRSVQSSHWFRDHLRKSLLALDTLASQESLQQFRERSAPIFAAEALAQDAPLHSTLPAAAWKAPTKPALASMAQPEEQELGSDTLERFRVQLGSLMEAGDAIQASPKILEQSQQIQKAEGKLKLLKKENEALRAPAGVAAEPIHHERLLALHLLHAQQAYSEQQISKPKNIALPDKGPAVQRAETIPSAIPPVPASDMGPVRTDLNLPRKGLDDPR